MGYAQARIDPIAIAPADIGEVRAIVQAAGSSFYWAMRFMPQRKREALFAIYAFCREVDDIADGDLSREEKIAALDHWRQKVDGMFAGRPSDAITRVLTDATQTFGLRRTDFIAVIQGMEMDARGPVVAPSLEELDLYCDCVAAAVGRLCVHVFGEAEAGQKVALGNEWSLTPQAQLAYSSIDFDGFTDPFGANVSLRQGDSLKGRLGVATNYDNDTAGRHVYGIANLTYEFLDGTSVAVSGTDLSFEQQRFGGELGLGGTYKWADGKYALHGEALASTSFAGGYGFKGTIGFTAGL